MVWAVLGIAVKIHALAQRAASPYVDTTIDYTAQIHFGEQSIANSVETYASLAPGFAGHREIFVHPWAGWLRLVALLKRAHAFRSHVFPK